MSAPFHSVPVKSDLSYDEFLQQHVLAQQPVLIKGALQKWNAIHWTPQSLKEKAGTRQVHYRTEGGLRSGRFGELLDAIFTPSTPAPYLRNLDLAQQLPELVADIQPEPVYSRSNWRSHFLMPQRWPPEVHKNLFELFVSQANATFPYLHIDYWGMSSFLAQLIGEKEVILFPPDDAPHLYANRLVSEIQDLDDLARYPKLAAARQHRVTLAPGDLLYNPAWWHTTRTTKHSATLIWAYWNRHEWTHLLEEVRRAGGIRGRLYRPYFRFVGACNRFLR